MTADVDLMIRRDAEIPTAHPRPQTGHVVPSPPAASPPPADAFVPGPATFATCTDRIQTTLLEEAQGEAGVRPARRRPELGAQHGGGAAQETQDAARLLRAPLQG